MAKFIVHGNKKLKGKIKTNTAKNSAVALLCASLMVEGEVVLTDLPKIEEVKRILEILKSIGVQFTWLDDRTLKLVSPEKLNLENINKQACYITRSSLLMIGALVNKVKSFKLPNSGGCKLGERTVRPHLYALENLGVSIKSEHEFYEIKNKGLKGAEIVMYESGDTPTENAIMAAVLAEGKTIIKYASANYQVQDLCYFLQAAGAKIEGIGTTTLEITGVKKLKLVDKYSIIPDPIEAMSFISIAITTGSHVTVENCPMIFLELELEKLKKMEQQFKVLNKRKSKNGKFEIADVEIIPSKLKALPDKIYGRPYPGLNIDNLPLFVPILTQAKGKTLVHDWVYENRAIYFIELNKLGASLTLYDPHRVSVEGPTKFKAAELVCPPALRPSLIILIAMLAAPGKSILRQSYAIDRGYENICERLNEIGADIERIEE